ncbi:DUF6310 domain-containing protein [Archangium lipolyticum]|uniref:DUF6310 domain-containing protein n=1 Tax=Archangium lipolyticum TaxID=2970465 RepID=UPI003899446A
MVLSLAKPRPTTPCRTCSDFIQEQTVKDEIEDLKEERSIAEACGYGFRWRERSPGFIWRGGSPRRCSSM